MKNSQRISLALAALALTGTAAGQNHSSWINVSGNWTLAGSQSGGNSSDGTFQHNGHEVHWSAQNAALSEDHLTAQSQNDERWAFALAYYAGFDGFAMSYDQADTAFAHSKSAMYLRYVHTPTLSDEGVALDKGQAKDSGELKINSQLKLIDLGRVIGGSGGWASALGLLGVSSSVVPEKALKLASARELTDGSSQTTLEGGMGFSDEKGFEVGISVGISAEAANGFASDGIDPVGQAFFNSNGFQDVEEFILFQVTELRIEAYSGNDVHAEADADGLITRNVYLQTVGTNATGEPPANGGGDDDDDNGDSGGGDDNNGGSDGGDGGA